MKVVILAGGMGTRISEESHLRPKPMIEIGGKPILWHIMKSYEMQGFNEFVICLGYKGYAIIEYFANYHLHNADVKIDLATNKVEIIKSESEKWKVTLVDTGLNTQTAGRIKRIRSHVGQNDFFLTYGDGLADVDLNKLLEFHRKHGKVATVTAVQPTGRFGVMQITSGGEVKSFMEKPKGDTAWVNGGFFVVSPRIFDVLHGDMDQTPWETTPMERLVQSNDLVAYKHNGFWKCMDALRDKEELELLWKSGKAQWKNW